MDSPRRWLTVVTTVFILGSLGLPASQATTTITGRVLDAASGEPVAGAVVSIVLPRQASPVVPILASSDGRFTISGIAGTELDLIATARGYLGSRLGAARPGGPGRPMSLGNSGRLDGLVIRLWKSARILGRIQSDKGDALEGVNVSVLRREIIAGRTRFTPTGTGVSSDTGHFRVSGLLPGSYVVAILAPFQTFESSTVELFSSARGGDKEAQAVLEKTFKTSMLPIARGAGMQIQGASVVPPPGGGALFRIDSATGTLSVASMVFYPSASGPEDGALQKIEAGEERSGIDFVLSLKPAAAVSGVLMLRDGTPAPYFGVRLSRTELGAVGTFEPFETGATITDRQGKFLFLGVPPGSYVIRSQLIPATSRPEDVGLFGASTVTVGNKDLSDLRIHLEAIATVSGKISVEGTSDADGQLSKMSVELVKVDGAFGAAVQAPKGPVASSGSFATSAVLPGLYVLRVNGSAEYRLKSAMYRGKDISDEPIQIDGPIEGVVVSVSREEATLSGSVRYADGTSSSDSTVLVFPADGRAPGLRRNVMVRPTADGRYTVGLPPGEYFVVAVNDPTNWEDPILLRTLASVGSRVTVSLGGRALDLIVARGRD